MSRYEPSQEQIDRFAQMLGVDDTIAAAEMDYEHEVMQQHSGAHTIGENLWECACGARIEGDTMALCDHRSTVKGYTVSYDADGKRHCAKTTWLWKK